jgi:hypothetical protein
MTPRSTLEIFTPAVQSLNLLQALTFWSPVNTLDNQIPILNTPHPEPDISVFAGEFEHAGAALHLETLGPKPVFFAGEFEHAGAGPGRAD